MNPRTTVRGRFPVASVLALAGLLFACTAVSADPASARSEPAPSPAGASGKRPFTVDDMFRLESLVQHYGGPFALSPDGRKVAIARVRPKATWTDYKLDFLGTAGADVWVQLDAGEPLRNVTNGIQDGSGWWAPQWSPDGERLAMLSTRGGNVYLWIWEARTGQLRQVTTRGIALTLARPYLWIDSQRLLYPALPPGEKPLLMQVEIQTAEIAPAMWLKARRGEGVTASVLQSGVATEEPECGKEELLVVSWDGRATERLASGRTRGWQLSPDRKALAFGRESKRLLRPEKVDSTPLWDVDIATFRGDSVEVNSAVARDVVPGTITWSPRSRSVAFLAYEAERRLLALVTLGGDGSGGSRVPLSGLPDAGPAMDTHQLTWADEQQLLLRARGHAGAERPRSDWWLVSRLGPAKCVTCAMVSVPPRLVPLPNAAGSFLGIAESELWRIDVAAGAVRSLTSAFAPTVRDFVRGATPDAIAFTAVSPDGKRTTYSWTAQGAEHLADAPELQAAPSLMSTGADTLLWMTDDQTGLRVWRTSTTNRERQLLMDCNGFLRHIEEGLFRRIEYEGPGGQALAGWLILPANFSPKTRYPLLTWVYPESRAPAQPQSHWKIGSGGALNPQIPVARGYAVLLPSIPLLPQGEADDPLLKLQDAVLPAIDEAIELGIADENRLFLIGHSFGGYATYGLVTQVHQFKAAVALAGPSNLVSYYGQWDTRFRYLDRALERTHREELENGQVRMGAPPWHALDRYLRNSPIFSVQHVETPLMIVHGDLDYVSLAQAEEFFLSLQRRGARAQFVRYWGEGHLLSSPANIRDFWARAFRWFDSFAPPVPNRSRVAP